MLDVARLFARGAQQHGDVVGDLIPRHRDHAGVTNRTACEQRKIRGATANVNQAHANLHLIRCQARRRRCERLQHQLHHVQTAAANALFDIVGSRHRTGDDVNFDLQPTTAHAKRTAHAFLPVDDVFLRQCMQHFLVVRNRYGACGFDHALHVGLGDLAVFHRHHAAGIQTANVSAGDADVDIGHLAIGHCCSFAHGSRNRVGGGININHHALAQTERRLLAKADDIELTSGINLCDQCDDFRGADV